MKKLMIFTVLMLSVSIANAGFFSKLKEKNQPEPSTILPPTESVPPVTQEVTVENEYIPAIEDKQVSENEGREGGNVSEVPVPAALPLMASALCVFGIARRRSFNK